MEVADIRESVSEDDPVVLSRPADRVGGVVRARVKISGR
jgi:hypothetical protein